jgi:transcriptional regulator with XRE-family HTH domain
MPNLFLATPEEISIELGQRARARRLALNLPIEELAARIGVSDRTLRSFELTGRCTLATFVRILEALNALADLQTVLVTQPRSIEDMRMAAQVQQRKRAYTKARPTPKGEAL